MDVREGRFSGPSYDTLAEGTVRGAISFVSQTYRENDRPNPTKDKDGKLGRVLSRQYRAFKNSDPNPAQQKATPICVVAKVFINKATDTQRATGQLGIGGFFIAGCSCEYMKVPQAEKRGTDILRLRCIIFFKDGRELQHSDLNHPHERRNCKQETRDEIRDERHKKNTQSFHNIHDKSD